ncbi:SDR family NAD(P)-dependent oxidoreductase [Mycolicibacterium fluoranthenivorans]|uniref:NAD(P)-dependent dehydrogenase, short-chain alcohol dehydrogenase family n=1 Tax=Mycolicibacterium fluoranthenivorans TaxID=258505 RepID=A0A1G4WW09_9MYCO|nr:SDR family NAD(P)-dependent oxidoreductase [Mycolicibacterium fluoranthenivorans]SCX30799.1 NAD(P)-dependent dehydrogenase, short-chain alcohol dehydrogenase family [Mycolicibacterium fluoranthenivorans]
MTSFPGKLFDALLDRTIAAGYSRVGYAVRERFWPALDPGALDGATVLVTGANSGIGKAIAAGAAELGATVLMTVRDRARGEAARDDIRAGLPGAKLVVQRCDVSDLAAVRAFAAELTASRPRLDAVIHNAGVMPPERTYTADGHELSLSTHVLGPLLLTELLLPALVAAPDPRVVLMSSGGMYTQPLPVDDIEYRKGRYRGATAYARSKRVQVALTPLLAKRWPVMVAAMHPGWADTPGVAESLPAFRRLTGPVLRTAEQAADTAIWLTATTPTPPSGEFWHDRRIRPMHYLPTTHYSDADLNWVWQYCTSAVGLA